MPAFLNGRNNMKRIQYEPFGWLDFQYVIDLAQKHNCCWVYIIGARGIGKTYGAFKYGHEHDLNYTYLRRTQTQADIAGSDELSPARRYYKDNDLPYYFSTIKGTKIRVLNEGEKKGEHNVRAIFGSAATFNNLRGIDAEDISVVFYDEFVPLASDTMRYDVDEGETVKHCYETINRNRELFGKEPLIWISMSNSDQRDNDLFVYNKLVDTAYRLDKSEDEYIIDHKKRTLIIQPKYCPIVDKKEETALYQSSEDTRFTDVALRNKYADADIDPVNRPLREYRLIGGIDGVCYLYEHKSKMFPAYVSCQQVGGSKKIYSDTERGREEFRREFAHIYYRHLSGKIEYNTLEAYRLFLGIMKKKY